MGLAETGCLPGAGQGVYVDETYIHLPQFFYSTGGVAFLKPSGYVPRRLWISGHTAAFINRSFIKKEKHKSNVIPADEGGHLHG